jgi:hypothetical protein
MYTHSSGACVDNLYVVREFAFRARPQDAHTSQSGSLLCVVTVFCISEFAFNQRSGNKLLSPWGSAALMGYDITPRCTASACICDFSGCVSSILMIFCIALIVLKGRGIL